MAANKLQRQLPTNWFPPPLTTL